jgi:DNA-binding response OmpR family regulator
MMKGELTPQQKTVLKLLYRANGGVVTYRLIELNLWPRRVVKPDVQSSWSAIIRHMREEGIPIESIHGVGYRLSTGDQT